MKTPIAYNRLINENKITAEILGTVLYSINKRAKNWRDKKRKYKLLKYDRYNNYEKALENEQHYYNMKIDILDRLQPTAIHKEVKIRERIKRIFDYEEEFSCIKDNAVIATAEYFDECRGSIVTYKKVKNIENKALYYLYYEIGEYGFHKPINEDDISKYNLEIYLLNNFITSGQDINDLLSTQFCQKVYRSFTSNRLVNIN